LSDSSDWRMLQDKTKRNGTSKEALLNHATFAGSNEAIIAESEAIS